MVINIFRLFLIIIICLVCLVLIIIGIIYIVKCYKKNKTKDILPLNSSINSIGPSSVEKQISIIRTTHNNNNINNNNNNNNIIQKKIKKKDYLTKEMKINAFCDCFLKPVKFSLIKVFNESCPIDLVPFKENEEVSVTKCLHAFHYNCIKKYLLENENNNELKCPICLTVLLEMDTKL